MSDIRHVSEQYGPAVWFELSQARQKLCDHSIDVDILIRDPEEKSTSDLSRRVFECVDGMTRLSYKTVLMASSDLGRE